MTMSSKKRSAAAKKAARTRKKNRISKGITTTSPRKIAEEYYKGTIVCVWCGYPIQSVLQVAHVIKSTPKNNKPSNLVWLCPTHHREYDLKLISKSMILERREFWKKDPKADWSNLFGLSQKQLSARAKKAHNTRKHVKNSLVKSTFY